MDTGGRSDGESTGGTVATRDGELSVVITFKPRGQNVYVTIKKGTRPVLQGNISILEAQNFIDGVLEQYPSDDDLKFLARHYYHLRAPNT
ncbi:MAG: hypothetical protein Q7R84_03540 [bacterium]|nr:hypothetical protein [bacterium]